MADITEQNDAKARQLCVDFERENFALKAKLDTKLDERKKEHERGMKELDHYTARCVKGEKNAGIRG